MPQTDALSHEPWWQRIRGARAISWPSVLGGNGLISVAIVASGGTLGGYAFGPEDVLRALVVVVLLGVVALLWALLGFRVMFRNRRVHPVSLWLYALYYSVNGTLYFLGVQWLDATSNTPSGIGWPARWLSSMAISLAWGIALSLLLDSSDRFRARRQQLVDELVAADLERLQESQEVLRLRAALDMQVDTILASTREELSRALLESAQAPIGLQQPTANPASAAAIVRTAASDVVRPLSHQLQAMADASFPPPGLRGVLRQWWRHPRMPPLATALLVSAQTSAESVRNFGGVLGPILSLLYCALLYLFLLAIDRLSRRLPGWGRYLYVVGVVGSLALNLGFAEGFSPEPTSTGDVVANVLVSLAYIAITSVIDAVRRARAGLIESMVREVDAEELRARVLQRETVRAVDALSRDLHGRVQTQLVVCAAELERAEADGDHEGITRALSEAASALESATRPRTSTLADVISAWDSVLSVRLDASSIGRDALERSDVVAVIEEGLGNAYRHGLASEATVAFEQRGDALRIVITDDGSGFDSITPGLGSDLLRRLSDGRFALVHGDGGTVLTVDLPAVAKSASSH